MGNQKTWYNKVTKYQTKARNHQELNFFYSELESIQLYSLKIWRAKMDTLQEKLHKSPSTVRNFSKLVFVVVVVCFLVIDRSRRQKIYQGYNIFYEKYTL